MGRSRKASVAESKGVVGSNVETEGRAERNAREREEKEKSLRIGVHHANAVVWGPV